MVDRNLKFFPKINSFLVNTFFYQNNAKELYQNVKKEKLPLSCPDNEMKNVLAKNDPSIEAQKHNQTAASRAQTSFKGFYLAKEISDSTLYSR